MKKFFKKYINSLDAGFLYIVSIILSILCYYRYFSSFSKEIFAFSRLYFSLFASIIALNTYFFVKIYKKNSLLSIFVKNFIIFSVFFIFCNLRYNNKLAYHNETKYKLNYLKKYFKNTINVTGNVSLYKPSPKSSYLVMERLSFNQIEIDPKIKIKLFVKGVLNVSNNDRILIKNIKINFIEQYSSSKNRKSIYYYLDILNKTFFSTKKHVEISQIELISKSNKRKLIDFTKIRLSIINNLIKNRNINQNNDDIGVVLAITTGNSAFINKDTMNNGIRKSGIAHIFAISGIHMLIIAGGMFNLSRFILVRNKFLNEQHDIKKISSVIAIFFTLIYLELSGISISALRSAIMFIMGLLAIILDRNTSIVRIYKVSFLALVINEPFVIFFPSFQLSFVCVLSLITMFRNFELKIQSLKDGIFIHRMIYSVLVLLISSCITTYSILPFEIYHFNQFTLIGIISNIVVIPFVEILILPFSFLGVILIPLFNIINMKNIFISIAAFFSKYLCIFAIFISEKLGSIQSNVVNGYNLTIISILIIFSYTSRNHKYSIGGNIAFLSYFCSLFLLK